MSQVQTRRPVGHVVLIVGLVLIGIGIVVTFTGYAAQSTQILVVGWPLTAAGVIVVAVGAAVTLLRRR